MILKALLVAVGSFSARDPTRIPCQARAHAPRLALLDAPTDDRRTREKALVTWLESNGVCLSPEAGWGRAAHPLRVEAETVEDFELSGRGLIARKELTQGQEIVKVPSKLLLTRKTAQRELGSSIVPDSLNEYLALALLLIHERSLGQQSFWASYIRILPTAEEVGQTWLWNEDDLALLEGSGILASTASLRAKIEREYAALLADILQPNGLDESVFSLEAFQWAMSMLLSRAIDLRETGELALVPYADLLNHSPYCSAYFFYNEVPFSKEREVVLYADRSYAKNDQVLISYGQKSNAELLLLYGFVVDRNLFDEVEVTISLDPTDPRYDEKAAFLQQQGLTPTMAFPLLIDRYSSELLQCARALATRLHAARPAEPETSSRESRELPHIGADLPATPRTPPSQVSSPMLPDAVGRPTRQFQIQRAHLGGE